MTIDELDTHRRLAGRQLRRLKLVGVIQELYASVLTHYAIRALMHEAAVAAGVVPTHVSFVGVLQVIQDAVRVGHNRQANPHTRSRLRELG